MKDHHDPKATPMFPQRIRTYLTFNVAIAVAMAIVMAVRAEFKNSHFQVIDFVLFGFYSAVLLSLFFGPIVVVEVYLYRRKKGAWYEWRNPMGRPRHDRTMSSEERRHWKSEAFRSRLFQSGQPQDDHRDRTRLFENTSAADTVSRAALLMTVADKFERSGKREAAERCYLQITQRFGDSPQAPEAARRLSLATKV
jgi:hypothetical protein